MEFIELKEISRKESPIHYINEYSGILVYKNNDAVSEQRIEFIVEKSALGSLEFRINHADENLANHITELENYLKDIYEHDSFE